METRRSRRRWGSSLAIFSTLGAFGAFGAVALTPARADAQQATTPAGPARTVDWSAVQGPPPNVRVDAYGGASFGSTKLGAGVGFRAMGTFGNVFHAGMTTTFFVPGAHNLVWTPALEIGFDPPTGPVEVRVIGGAGVVFGGSEILPTVYPAVLVGYRDRSRKFFVGGEFRVNVISTFGLQAIVTSPAAFGGVGGYI